MLSAGTIRRPLLTTLVAVLATTGLLQAQSLAHATPEEVGMSSVRLERLTDALQGYVDADRLSGAVAMVLRGGKVAYLEAVGARDVEARAPLEEDAIFRIYSMTKPITSVATMMLYERGLFQLRDPVTKFVPEFKGQGVFQMGNYPQLQDIMFF